MIPLQTAIDHSTVHRLTSGQVVIDLQTAGKSCPWGSRRAADCCAAVKELLENALDAGATSVGACSPVTAEQGSTHASYVVITFKEHGLESIEVQDNGRGIDKEDWAGIGAHS